jgi:hypothetical protein
LAPNTQNLNLQNPLPAKKKPFQNTNPKQIEKQKRKIPFHPEEDHADDFHSPTVLPVLHDAGTLISLFLSFLPIFLFIYPSPDINFFFFACPGEAKEEEQQQVDMRSLQPEAVRKESLCSRLLG